MKLKMRPAHLILTVLIKQSLIEIIVKNNIPNDNKIVQYYNLKDINHDISSQFIILKNTDREVCPELRVKLLDNLNYSRSTLDNLRVTLTKLQFHPVNQAVLQNRVLLKYLNIISLIC